MKSLDSLTYHPEMTKLVNTLCIKTQNQNPMFFRVMASYYFAKIASMMRCNIQTHDRGVIPVSMYAMNLASCVSNDTEFLTPTGWKRMDEYVEGDKVLEVDIDTFKASFKIPVAYINQPTTENAYWVNPTDRTKTSMIVSPNHKIPYRSLGRSGKYSTLLKTADDLFKMDISSKGIFSKFKLDSMTKLDMTHAEIKVQIAFAADGSLKPKRTCGAKLCVKKQRKIDRLHTLLIEANIEYYTTIDSGQTAFWFTPPLLEKGLDWAWKANLEQLEVITHESIYWDGSLSPETKNYVFCTTLKSEADFMQYAYQNTFDTYISLNTLDNRGKTQVSKVNGKTYAKKSIDYVVEQTSSKVKNIMPKNVIRKPMPDGRQYCFTTSTGYWVMRHNNSISITHNSGQGKGFSTSLVEEKVIHKFKANFLDTTFPEVAEENLAKLAIKKTTKTGLDPDTALEAIQGEFNSLGTLMFGFDSGTTPALKQMRHKLLMANAGSLNLEIDEVAANLLGNIEVLTTYLELYDIGVVKQKLLKNTKENTRVEEITGRTPTNMMLFGTPAKLMDGAKIEDEFRSMLTTGYARRCIFGYNKLSSRDNTITAEEIYDQLTNTNTDAYLDQLAQQLGGLADKINFGINLSMTKEVSITLIEYKMNCENRSDKFADYEETHKAEMSHRYFKALKLAGAYAFVDGDHEISEDNLYAAIHLVEESGKAFHEILQRPKNYEKLADYIAKVDKEITHVDIQEDLPFFRGSEAHRRELMNLAIAYGVKNNISITKTYTDDIEFIKGESLAETNLDEMIISYSTDFTEGYNNQQVPFDQLHKLVSLDGYHFVIHHLLDGYRKDDNCIPGFNLAVIDVDGGVDILTVKLLLQDHKFLLYETKRSTADENRFRIVFPMSHTLTLNKQSYKDFMINLYDWLPFDVDRATNNPSRKWLTNPSKPFYNQGELLDVTLFIENTKRSDDRKIIINNQQSFNSLQRWFLNSTNQGNRSNQLIKFGLMLVDAGKSLEDIKNAIMDFNNRLPDKLEDAEIYSTLFATITKKVIERGNP